MSWDPETNARTTININNYLARIGFWGPHARRVRGQIRGPKLPRTRKEMALRRLFDMRLTEFSAQQQSVLTRSLKRKHRIAVLKAANAKLKKRLRKLARQVH